MTLEAFLIITLNLLPNAIFWSMGIFVMAASTLGKRIRILAGLTYSGIFFPLQLVMNILLLTLLDYNVYAWDIGLFTFQAFLLALVLSHFYQESILKTFSAAALCHFMLYTFYAITENFLLLSAPSLEQLGLLASILLLNVLPHFLVFCLGLLMALYLQKTQFYSYFFHLFTTRKKAAATLAICFLLMNSYALLSSFFPALIDPSKLAIPALFFVLVALLLFQLAAMFVAGQEKIRLQEETIRQQQAQVELLEELQTELRTFRHDFQNLLSGAALQAREGDLAGVENFLRSTTGYFDQKLGNEIKQLGSLAQFKIPPLRSLLSLKLALLHKQNIAAQLEALRPVTRLGMQTEDFLRCLGILIDNAAEAAAQCDKGMVSLLFLQEETELRVVVSNTCTAKPDLIKMKNPHYTTKGAGRGTGLVSYRRILRNYRNCVSRCFWEDGFFTQEIRIQLCPPGKKGTPV